MTEDFIGDASEINPYSTNPEIRQKFQELPLSERINLEKDFEPMTYDNMAGTEARGRRTQVVEIVLTGDYKNPKVLLVESNTAKKNGQKIENVWSFPQGGLKDNKTGEQLGTLREVGRMELAEEVGITEDELLRSGGILETFLEEPFSDERIAEEKKKGKNITGKAYFPRVEIIKQELSRSELMAKIERAERESGNTREVKDAIFLTIPEAIKKINESSAETSDTKKQFMINCLLEACPQVIPQLLPIKGE